MLQYHENNHKEYRNMCRNTSTQSHLIYDIICDTKNMSQENGTYCCKFCLIKHINCNEFCNAII